MVNALLSQLFLECVAGLNERKGCIFTNDMKLTGQNMKYFVHIVCNEIQVKVNLEITTFFFYLRFPYCPNFFWFGVVQAHLKHSGGNVMAWAFITSSGTGSFIFINDVKHDGSRKINSEVYRNILSDNLQKDATKLIGRSFIMQQDNDPKHSAKTTKEFIRARSGRF